MTKIKDRDQIVDAAALLFGEKGYEATSLDEVAAYLGTARSALYYHVSGKAELRSLIQIRRVQMLSAECRAIVDSAALASEKLAGLARTHLAHFERFYPESRSWTLLKASPEAQDGSTDAGNTEQHKVYACFRQVIADGIATGEFRATDPAIAALGVIGMCNYVTNWYRPGGGRTIDEVAETFAAMAVGALRA